MTKSPFLAQRRADLANQADRLPPGQVVARGFRVLTIESETPTIDLSTWRLEVGGRVGTSLSLSYTDLRAFSRRTACVDIHCVTRWSRLGMTWTGVPVTALVEAARVEAGVTHVVARSLTGYTSSLSFDDVTRAETLVAFEVDGEPLSADHGGPVRLLVPHLYFWKSAKWLSALHFLDHEELGYWEERGYHRTARPWMEERFEL